MDLKQIERLMAALGRNGIKRMALKQEGFEIELEKEYSGSFVVREEPAMRMPPAGPALPSREEKKETHKETKEGTFITSPMVGTFYSAPSPDDPAFIKIGDKVEPKSVVCIIEAMKVMNEVKAGLNGTITEILVKNGDPLEFGTKIFRVS